MSDAQSTWLVIANCEDQFAIWSASSPVPQSWRAIGVRGPAAECEAYIRRVEGERQASALRRCLECVTIRP